MKMRNKHLPLFFIQTTLWIMLLFVLLPFISQSQVSEGGVPLSTSISLSQNYPIAKMATPNVQQAITEDAAANKPGPWRFGINIPVSLDIVKNGETTLLADGSKLIRQGIRSAGAMSINLTFSKYRLPIGAKLFMYDKNKREILGAFTKSNNQADEKLGTALLVGEEIVLEYYEPANPEFLGELVVDNVTHGYKNAFGFAKAFGSSESCEKNVNCPEAADWQCEKRSVVMLVVNSNGFCTGSLVNNTSQDKTPYVLTADHCLGSSVSNWVFYFNWESPTCANPPSSPPFQSMSGATLKAANFGTDVALVQINGTVPDTYNATYAGWSREGTIVSASYGIHHPAGDIKKFSTSANATASSTYGGADCWRTGLWTLGVTEPGSSGSPLFDPNHRIIGQLVGGPSSCTAPASNKYDFYGKFHASWSAGSSSSSRLKEWLDPLGTNQTTLDILDWFPISISGTSTICNGESATFNAAVGGVPPLTYQWQRSNDNGVNWNNIATATAATYSFNTIMTDNGNQYRCIVGKSCGTVTSSPVILTIATPTAPIVNANGPTTFCNGGSVTLNSNVGINDALNFVKTSNQYVSVPHSASINLGATFTMEAWVRYSGPNSTIIDKGNYNFLWSLNANSNGNKMGFYTRNTGAWVYSTGIVPENTWTHVAITLSAGTLTFYINGVAAGASNPVTFSQDGLEMNIGRQQPTFCVCNHFNGTMDELRIWNVVRTQAQIQGNSNNTIPTNSAGLVAYYKFDEGTGITTADATSNGNSGTLVNAPIWQVPATSPVNRVVWSPGGATTPTIVASIVGTYTATVTNGYGCSSTAAGVNVNVLPKPNLGPDKIIYHNCLGEFTHLVHVFTYSGGGVQEWNYSPASAAPPGYYRLVLTNQSQCTDTAFVDIKLEVARWTGTVSSDWHNAANWNINKVPTAQTHVIVNAGTPNPCIISAQNATAASVQVFDNANMQLINNRNIMINGKCFYLPPN